MTAFFFSFSFLARRIIVKQYSDPSSSLPPLKSRRHHSQKNPCEDLASGEGDR
jgi:hypothetical protein